MQQTRALEKHEQPGSSEPAWQWVQPLLFWAQTRVQVREATHSYRETPNAQVNYLVKVTPKQVEQGCKDLRNTLIL